MQTHTDTSPRPLPNGVTIRSWTDSRLPALVRFWNQAFASRWNAIPMTEDLFRNRVLTRHNQVESFDPEGLLVALQESTEAGEDRETIIGLAHATIHDESFCRAAFPDWPGGSQGYLAFLHVSEAWRRQGIGDQLLEQARSWCRGQGASQMRADGPNLNPFHGNSEAPFTPWFDTPEGISVPAEDQATRSFLARRGFRETATAVTYQVTLQPDVVARTAQQAAEKVAGQGYRLELITDAQPILDGNLDDLVPHRPGHPFRTATALASDGSVAATCVGYTMSELRPDKGAIYEVRTAAAHQGRGLGRAVVSQQLADMHQRGIRECEVLTIPDQSPAAPGLYSSLGFSPVREWVVVE